MHIGKLLLEGTQNGLPQISSAFQAHLAVSWYLTVPSQSSGFQNHTDLEEPLVQLAINPGLKSVVVIIEPFLCTMSICLDLRYPPMYEAVPVW